MLRGVIIIKKSFFRGVVFFAELLPNIAAFVLNMFIDARFYNGQ